MNRSKQLIWEFAAVLIAQGFDAKLDDRLDDHPGLNVLIPLQEDGTELVFFEAHYIHAYDRFDVIQLYTTLVGELSPSAASETAKAIAVWNRDFLLGSLGLLDDRQLYHRYCLTLPASFNAKQTAEYAFDVFSMILGQISEYHEDTLSLASGVSFEALCAAD